MEKVMLDSRSNLFNPKSIATPSALPPDLLLRQQFVLYRNVQKPGDKKPRRIPYYTNGDPRGTRCERGMIVERFPLDSPEDIARLGSYEEVLAEYQRHPDRYSGIGFALLPGDGIGGIDLDNCLDADGNFISEDARRVFESAKGAGVYLERSPSGRGIRGIGQSADFPAFKPACGGFEAYSSKRYLTITGDCIANPGGFGDIAAALATMKEVVGSRASGSTEQPPCGSGGTPSGRYVAPQAVTEGGRNSALLAQVGHLRANGLQEADILQAAHDFNRACCIPPLDGAEVEDIVKRYAQPATSGAGDWPEPEPIEPPLPTVPPFPLDCLPKAFRDYVADQSELMQCPAEYIAVPMTVAAAATLGNGFAIAPKARDYSWRVVASLWGGIVGRPGVMKSPAMNKGLAPLRILEEEMAKAYEQVRQKYRADKLYFDAQFQSAKRSASKGQMVPIPPEPVEPQPERLLINDTTYQKLTEILRWSLRGVLCVSDELIQLLKSLDAEGQEGARAFYLQGWNGDQSYRVDRVTRGSFVIPQLTIWLVGGIQPGRLQEYVLAAVRGGAGDDGLMQRLQLLVWPDTPAEFRNIDRPPDLNAYGTVEKTFKYLRALDPASVGAQSAIGGGPAYLHFDANAQRWYDAFRERLESQLRSEQLHSALESHLAKCRSLVPALALVIHLADGHSGPVSHSAMVKALNWFGYLFAHAKRVYSVAINAPDFSTKELADKLVNGKLPSRFSSRDVYRHNWQHLKNVDQVNAALTRLIDARWLREDKVHTDGRPTVLYTVNPRVTKAR
jgi:hypothetical protein